MQIKFKFIESLIAFTLRNTPIQVGDTLLDALGKLQGQINDRALKAGDTFTGPVLVSQNGSIARLGVDSGGNLSLGRVDGVASGPFIDFNSSATASDFDVRLSSSGGNGIAGEGNLDIQAARISTDAFVRVDTSSTEAALRVTQRGTGAALLIEDSTNPDSSPFMIDANGNVNVGSVNPQAAVNFNLTRQLTGGTSAVGFRSIGAIQADVTNVARYVQASASTAADTFTVNSIEVFSAAQGTFGAGSTVNEQIGYLASSTLVGAASNFGFRGNIPVGPGRWNLYMGGNAANYMAGQLLLGTLTGSERLVVQDNSANAAVRITQTGSGDALLVEDSSNPDATPFRIDLSGNVFTDNSINHGGSYVNTGTANIKDLFYSEPPGAGAGSSAVRRVSGGYNQLHPSNGLYEIGRFNFTGDAQNLNFNAQITVTSVQASRMFSLVGGVRTNAAADLTLRWVVSSNEFDAAGNLGQLRLFLAPYNATGPVNSRTVIVCWQAGPDQALTLSWLFDLFERGIYDNWSQVNAVTVFNPAGFTEVTPYVDPTGMTFSQRVAAPQFTGPLAGNASTASALQSPRTITLSGDVTGSATFDGSQNITINTVSSASSVAFIDGGTFTTNPPSVSPAFKVDFGSFN